MGLDFEQMIKDLQDPNGFDDLLQQIISRDGEISEHYICCLHLRCAELLVSTEMADRHRWSALVFQGQLCRPIMKKTEKGRVFLTHFSPIHLPHSLWENLPKQAFEYLFERACAENSPKFKVQHLAFLFETKVIWKKYEASLPFRAPAVAKALTAACLDAIRAEISRKKDGPKEGMAVREYFEIAAFLATRFKDVEGVKTITSDLLEYGDWLLEEASHWALDLCELLTYLAAPDERSREKELLSDAFLEKAKDLTRRVIERHEAQPGKPDAAEEYIALWRMERLLGEKVSREQNEERIAESIIKRGSFFPNFIKVGRYKDAAAHFAAANLPEKAAKAKNDSRLAMRLAIENNELKPITTSIRISHDDMEKSMLPFFEGAEDSTQVLFRLSQTLFAPSIESGRSPKVQSSIAHLIPVTPIVDDRVKATVPGSGDGGVPHEVAQSVVREIVISASIGLVPIFEKLRSEWDLNWTDLFTVISASQFWRDEDVPFLRTGAKRFLEVDYISSIHVLVPRVEQLIRLMLIAVGMDATAYKNGSLIERPLGELLREADEKGAMPKEILRLLQLTLSEESGLNLRNRVAHGLITESQTGCDTACRILHLLILLNSLGLSEGPT